MLCGIGTLFVSRHKNIAFGFLPYLALPENHGSVSFAKAIWGRNLEISVLVGLWKDRDIIKTKFLLRNFATIWFYKWALKFRA